MFLLLWLAFTAASAQELAATVEENPWVARLWRVNATSVQTVRYHERTHTISDAHTGPIDPLLTRVERVHRVASDQLVLTGTPVTWCFLWWWNSTDAWFPHACANEGASSSDPFLASAYNAWARRVYVWTSTGNASHLYTQPLPLVDPPAQGESLDLGEWESEAVRVDAWTPVNATNSSVWMVFANHSSYYEVGATAAGKVYLRYAPLNLTEDLDPETDLPVVEGDGLPLLEQEVVRILNADTCTGVIALQAGLQDRVLILLDCNDNATFFWFSHGPELQLQAQGTVNDTEHAQLSIARERSVWLSSGDDVLALRVPSLERTHAETLNASVTRTARIFDSRLAVLLEDDAFAVVRRACTPDTYFDADCDTFAAVCADRRCHNHGVCRRQLEGCLCDENWNRTADCETCNAGFDSDHDCLACVSDLYGQACNLTFQECNAQECNDNGNCTFFRTCECFSALFEGDACVDSCVRANASAQFVNGSWECVCDNETLQFDEAEHACELVPEEEPDEDVPLPPQPEPQQSTTPDSFGKEPALARWQWITMGVLLGATVLAVIYLLTWLYWERLRAIASRTIIVQNVAHLFDRHRKTQ